MKKNDKERGRKKKKEKRRIEGDFARNGRGE